MARWTANTNQVALRELFGPFEEDVEAKVVDVMTVQGQVKQDNTQSIGIIVKMQMVTGPASGKRIDGILWLHTEDTVRITKQAQMAILGYETKQEAEFNAWSEEQDWLVDGDNKLLGEGWKSFIGRVVKLKLDVKPNKQNGELQQVIFYRPLV